MRFFNLEAPVEITQRRLPHWAQAGTLCFITWRTHDSMPQAVIERWHRDREAWLLRHRIDPAGEDRKERLEELEPAMVAEFHENFTTRWHEELDACHGECVLRRPALARLVSECLLHHDGKRYEMHDFVVMPNHVHLLVVFEDEAMMLRQCESWKRYTATQINGKLGRKGRFWQTDAFDHLVRHEGQFERLRRYIAENPMKARLRAGEFVHYSKSSPHTPCADSKDDASRGA